MWLWGQRLEHSHTMVCISGKHRAFVLCQAHSESENGQKQTTLLSDWSQETKKKCMQRITDDLHINYSSSSSLVEIFGSNRTKACLSVSVCLCLYICVSACVCLHL